MNRIRILAGLGAVSVVILGLLAWQLGGEWIENPDLAAADDSPADNSIAATESPLAPSDDEPIILADESGHDMTLYADDRLLGNPEAPITLIEYASLTCPHCASFHNDVLPEIKANYIDQGLARLVFRDFPLDQVALHGAQIAQCAPDGSLCPRSCREEWPGNENTVGPIALSPTRISYSD